MGARASHARRTGRFLRLFAATIPAEFKRELPRRNSGRLRNVSPAPPPAKIRPPRPPADCGPQGFDQK